jgi:hypothetical protein
VSRAVIRFAFALTTEDGETHSGGHFRIWCNKDDTYIAERGTGALWKTSLHGDAAWRTAETAESFTSDRPMLNGSPDRAPWKYTPTPFVGGRRLAYVIACTRGAMMPEQVKASYSIIPVADRWDQLTKANVWMSEANITPDDEGRIGPRLSLQSGRSVWVTPAVEYIPPIEPEPTPATTLLRPMIPGKDDVRYPGVIVVGVHLG